MDSGAISALTAAAVAAILTFASNRLKAKGEEGKRQAEVIAADTARKKVLAELDDIAMDRAARINETIIDGLNLRIDLFQAEQEWAEQVIFTLRRALQDAGIALPAVPPRPVRR